VKLGRSQPARVARAPGGSSQPKALAMRLCGEPAPMLALCADALDTSERAPARRATGRRPAAARRACAGAAPPARGRAAGAPARRGGARAARRGGHERPRVPALRAPVAHAAPRPAARGAAPGGRGRRGLLSPAPRAPRQHPMAAASVGGGAEQRARRLAGCCRRVATHAQAGTRVHPFAPLRVLMDVATGLPAMHACAGQGHARGPVHSTILSQAPRLR